MRKRKAKKFSNQGFRDDDLMFFSFDTETDKLGGDLLMITAHSLSSEHVFDGPMMVANFFNLMSEFPYPCVWYAHHAQYDWRYFIEFIVDNQIHCEINMRSETDIYEIVLYLEGQRIVMRDSLAVFPSKLSDFAKAFAPEIPKGFIDFESTTFDPKNPDHIQYALRDSEILRRGMPRFNFLLNKYFGVNVGCTTAGTALKAWQHSLGDGVFYEPSNNDEREAFVRDGYFGGLVFLTRNDTLKSESVCAETFDINSSYPYSMTKYGVPSGRMIETDDYESGLMGIYRVRVRTPADLVIPILPRRNAKGYMRWNRGEFETVVTSSELIFAANNGYEILDVISGYAWEEVAFPFNDIINQCKEMRDTFKGMPEEILAKLIQNALYGKLGSRRERMRVFVPENDEDMLDAHPIDDHGYFWCKKELSETLRCKPEWAVFITAHSRLKLISTAYSVGIENVIYGDTDSLTVLAGHGHHFDTGSDYGQWKLEKRWKSFRAIAPKVYVGVTEEDIFKGAVKGIPKKSMNPEAWEGLMEDGVIDAEFDSLPSLRVAMKTGISPSKRARRKSTDIANSVNWELRGNLVIPKMAS